MNKPTEPAKPVASATEPASACEDHPSGRDGACPSCLWLALRAAHAERDAALAELATLKAGPTCIWCRHPDQLACAVRRADGAERERDAALARADRLAAELAREQERFREANAELQDMAAHCQRYAAELATARADLRACWKSQISSTTQAVILHFRSEALRWAAEQVRGHANRATWESYSTIDVLRKLADRIERGPAKEE